MLGARSLVSRFQSLNRKAFQRNLPILLALHAFPLHKIWTHLLAYIHGSDAVLQFPYVRLYAFTVAKNCLNIFTCTSNEDDLVVHLKRQLAADDSTACLPNFHVHDAYEDCDSPQFVSLET